MSLAALPILIPLVLILFLIIIRSNTVARWTGIVGSAIILMVPLILLFELKDEEIIYLNMGGWEAPFGISLVVDYLSVIMLLTASLIVLAIAIFSLKFIEEEHRHTRFYVFFFSLIMGVNGSLVTGDVFNLYVWFELLLTSSFVLITIERTRDQLEGGLKYMALNLLGSLLFLAGAGLLYGKTGTLNMAHLAEILRNNDRAIWMNSTAMLFFIAFGIKAAVFPLFFWLPSSYHTPNITISALYAGLLTKVGVYALFRFFTLFFVQNPEFWHQLLLVVAGLTMAIGGIAASAHYETRRILSWHIISQIGYMIMGLGIYTPLAIAGAIYFTVHNMVAKTNAFLVSGLINKVKGTYYLKDVGGLYQQHPFLALLFIIPAFALAGVPPLSGFFAKFILIKAGIEAERYGVTAIAILTGMLTLYSMLKIWSEAFLKKQPEKDKGESRQVRLTFSELLPSMILAMISILMGIFASRVFDFVMKAANQLSDPSAYIENILKL